MDPFFGVGIVHGNHNVANLFFARKEGQSAFDKDDEHTAELPAAYVGVAIDNARLYKQAVDATRARDDLLATVSHDLKNPLNAIRMSATPLRARGGEDQIEAGALRAVRRPQPVASRVNATVEMFAPLAAEKSIRLSSATPPGDVGVLDERDLVLRVFPISSATPSSSAGRALPCASQPSRWPATSASTLPIAVPESPPTTCRTLSSVTGSRRTVIGAGSSLGLYIAKGIVEAHDGTIWITSSPGRGTTVYFTLAAGAYPLLESGRPDA